MTSPCKCPTCGAPAVSRLRKCGYCNTVLVNTGVTIVPDHGMKTGETIAKWRELLKEDPNHLEANYAIGLLYLNQRLNQEAAQHLSTAVQYMPENAQLHYSYAMALWDNGAIAKDSPDFNVMQDEFEKALRIDPEFSEARACMYLLKGLKIENDADAILMYEQGFKACPDIPLLCNDLAVLNLNLCNGIDKAKDAERFKKAETYLTKSYETDPRGNLLLRNFSYLYGRQCQFANDEGDFTKGILIGEKGRQLIDQLDELLVDENSRREKAVFYHNYSCCLLKGSRPLEAIELLNKAVSLAPDDAVLRATLAQAEQQLKDTEHRANQDVKEHGSPNNPSNVGALWTRPLNIGLAIVLLAFVGYSASKLYRSSSPTVEPEKVSVNSIGIQSDSDVSLHTQINGPQGSSSSTSTRVQETADNSVQVATSAVQTSVEPMHRVENNTTSTEVQEDASNAIVEQSSPSFDCEKAKAKIERQICASPKLASLDVNLSETYKGIQKYVDKKQLKSEQIAWIKERNACADDMCLEHSYKERLDGLKDQLDRQERAAAQKYPQ